MADKKISELTALTSPADDDEVPIVDTNVATTKRITWAYVKSVLKTYFDTLYSAITHASNHTDGTDDIQNATSGQKGLATAAQITKLDGIATGADVTGDNAPQAHKDSHDPNDGSDALDCAAPGNLDGVQASGEGSAHSLARSDPAHRIQHSIADNAIMTVDGSPNNGEYARFTANGLEGRTVAEVIAELFPDIRARAYLSADQDNLGDGDWTKVLLDTESYDIGSDFDTGNNQYVVPTTGLYAIHACVVFEQADMVGDRTVSVGVYVDPLGAGADALVMQSGFATDTNNKMAAAISDEIVLNASDEVSLWACANTGGNNTDIESGATQTFLTIRLIRAT